MSALRPLLLVLPLLVGACSARLRLSDYSVGQPVLAGAARDEVAARAVDRGRALQSVRGLYRCEITAGGPKDAWRYVAVYEPPSKLRVELLPLNGFYTVGLFVVSNGRAWFLDTERKEAVSSAEPARLLERYLQLPLSAGDFGALLAGVLPSDVLSTIDSAAIGAAKTPGEVSIKSSRTFSLLDSDGAVKTIHFFEPRRQREVLEVGLGDYQAAGAMSVPHRLTVKILEHGITLVCGAQQAALNVTPRESLFEFVVPPGYAERSLD